MTIMNSNGFTGSSTTLQFKLGTEMQDAATGKWYLYVQVSASSANACSNGRVMLHAGSFVVSDDISANKANDVIGIGVGAIAKGSYGWIQIWGEHSAIKTNGDDDIADGVALIPMTGTGATYDGMCDSVAAGTAPTYKVIGWSTAADVDSQNTVAGFITLR